MEAGAHVVAFKEHKCLEIRLQVVGKLGVANVLVAEVEEGVILHGLHHPVL